MQVLFSNKHQISQCVSQTCRRDFIDHRTRRRQLHSWCWLYLVQVLPSNKLINRADASSGIKTVPALWLQVLRHVSSQAFFWHFSCKLNWPDWYTTWCERNYESQNELVHKPNYCKWQHLTLAFVFLTVLVQSRSKPSANPITRRLFSWSDCWSNCLVCG